jgi:hypothetical protein
MSTLANNVVFENLLELLRQHPEIVREIVLDPINLTGALKAAEAANFGEDTRKFLTYVAGERDGYNIVQFLHNTSYIGMCAKGTSPPLLQCLRGTNPTGGWQ